ncbi:MAG TPA: hypothetical protein PLW65_34230 [Pseudomonadota bacterium]|nr:hypothetical protein [Pseudomonadota bacterium]
MDVRTLLPLAPAWLRGALEQLLGRLEACERNQAAMAQRLAALESRPPTLPL